MSHPGLRKPGGRLFILRCSMQALACGCLLAMSNAAPAQTAPPPQPGQLQIPRVEGAVILDGALDEPVWRQAAQIDLAYEVDPSDNTRAPVTFSKARTP